MIFEIVNHSYRYSRLLAYQLSSLVVHCPKMHRFVYTVFFDPNDSDTSNCLSFFRPLMPENLRMNVLEMPLPLLRNRALGRNMAALATTADWVWFTDTDYCFVGRIWEDLYDSARNTTADLMWPMMIRETDWTTGESLIKAMNHFTLGDVPLSDTYEKRMSRAIGGIQIARGSVVREIGYCPQFTGPSNDWNFRSDVKFRKMFSKVKPVSVNYSIRIRHENKGYGNLNNDGVSN